MNHDIRYLAWHDIEAEFGPLVEIALAPDGLWDMDAIRGALADRRLWTRVDPGLVSTGLHYVNRECYLIAARPYTLGDEIVEIDPDVCECDVCGDVFFFDGQSECPCCGTSASSTK